MPIYFCGDVTIDNYEFYGAFKFDGAIARSRQDFNKVIARQFGGAHLLQRFTTAAWTLWHSTSEQPIDSLEPWKTFKKEHEDYFLNPLFWTPRKFDAIRQVSYRVKRCEDKQFRVPRGGHEGFAPPIGRLLPENYKPPHEPVIRPGRLSLSVGSKHLFVINDVAQQARDADDLLWTKAASSDVTAQPGSWVVMKMLTSQDKKPHPLLEKLKQDSSHRDNLIVIVPADELRKAGAPISSSLSWEHTLRDTITQIKNHSLLESRIPRHLVITFSYDAALYLDTNESSGVLIFSINGAEGEFANAIDGDMPGAQSMFVSVFCALLYYCLENGQDIAWAKLLSYALIAKRRFLRSGFDTEGKNPFVEGSTFLPANDGNEREEVETARLSYSDGILSLPQKGTERPHPLIGQEKDEAAKKRRSFRHPLKSDDFAKDLEAEKLERFPFPAALCAQGVPGKKWSIFRDVFAEKKRSEFIDYVVTGKLPKEVPVGQFGKINTADVGEIEGFRAIQKLLHSYLSSDSTKPLGIAVFGPPGAGKGFSVKNILENLPEPLKKLVKDDRHESNLTALSDPEDLAHYFQLARNSALRGKVPVLFFDEFDCSVGGTQFFWLKHFLAPLQDGEFRSQHIVHPIGRAIFVFAGGVRETFDQFRKDMQENQNLQQESHATQPKPKEKETDNTQTQLRETTNKPNFKGVDFLSRLHGYIDVTGLSPSRTEREAQNQNFFSNDFLTDASYLMRRAFVLRSMLESNMRKIFPQGTDGDASINRRVIFAFLATTEFRHGARSMEAIIRMSSLQDGDSFEVAHLPPDNQLGIHVDPENFRKCLENDFSDWAAAHPTNPA